ncbi:hypothetical protein MTO96_012329 [Rhipicephalus appendiculatus]
MWPVSKVSCSKCRKNQATTWPVSNVSCSNCRKNQQRQSVFATAAAKATVIQGPYRAASKAGVLITTCRFADIYNGIDSLNEKKKELSKSTDTYTLGGYTFMLQSKHTKNENEINVSFALFLREGEWDSYVDWPFKKKVALIIMHTKDAAKDIRLPITMVDYEGGEETSWQ